MRFVGAVLTGGSSRRMGRDKAAVPVGGVPMALRVAAALGEAGAAAVALIGRAVDGAEGVAVVEDDHPGDGPLGGVLTALRWAGQRRLVVAPCDLVAPDAVAFRRLVDAGGYVAVAGPGDPLPLAIDRTSVPALERAFNEGERSLRRAVASLRPADAGLPVEARRDADTPSELPPGSG